MNTSKIQHLPKGSIRTTSNIFITAIRFLVYSNIFIALCASAYAAKTSLLLYGNNGNWHVNVMVFCLVLFFYCFHRINKKKFLISDEDNESRNSWMGAHIKTYYILIVISVISLTVQFFYLPLRAWFIFIPAGLIGAAYTFPIIFTGKAWKRLRDISWLKPVWIALVFSLLTTWLPVVFTQPVSCLFKPEVLFIFGRSFFFVFALCIPFDIRDRDFDEQRGVNTLPVIIGAKTSIYIAITSLLIFITLICIQFLYFKLDFKPATVLFFSAVLTIFSLLFANFKRPPLFYPLIFDGAMMLQWVLIVIFY